MKKKFNQKIYYYFFPLFLGIISSYSLPPYNFIVINFLTFPLFLFCLIEAKKKKSIWLNFVIGWSFGIGYFFSNIYWIVYSLTFEDIFKPLIPVALIIIPSFLGLFYGLITLLASQFKLEKNFNSILIFSAIFASIEFVRGFIFGGFPWNLIVYSWTSYLNSIQILSLVGTYSFNLISLTIFLFPLIIFTEKKKKYKFTYFTFLILILLSNHFYGYQKIKNNEKYYKKFEDFKIKLISPKISIDRFFQADNEKIIIDELIELSEPNLLEKTIFVYPEGALAGVNFDKLKTFSKTFSKRFSDFHIIIMGINTERIIDNSNRVYNSMVVLDSKLNLIDEYNKIKLVPFGEFLPLEGFFKKIGLKKISFGYESFSKGKNRNLIFLNQLNFNFIPLICYEIIYSGNIDLSLNRTNFIINISEDGWFGNSIGPHQHFSHSIFRAIEEGKNIIRVSNNGISAFIDGNGLILSKLESTNKGVIEINNYKSLKKTLFSKLGNNIFFYFILFYISLIFFNYKKRER